VVLGAGPVFLLKIILRDGLSSFPEDGSSVVPIPGISRVPSVEDLKKPAMPFYSLKNIFFRYSQKQRPHSTAKTTREARIFTGKAGNENGRRIPATSVYK
jgi:hypothetical protein